MTLLNRCFLFFALTFTIKLMNRSPLLSPISSNTSSDTFPTSPIADVTFNQKSKLLKACKPISHFQRDRFTSTDKSSSCASDRTVTSTITQIRTELYFPTYATSDSQACQNLYFEDLSRIFDDAFQQSETCRKMVDLKSLFSPLRTELIS